MYFRWLVLDLYLTVFVDLLFVLCFGWPVNCCCSVFVYFYLTCAFLDLYVVWLFDYLTANSCNLSVNAGFCYTLVYFEQAKRSLSSLSLLVHYNPALLVLVATHASAYGIGAIFAHVLPDGSERPVAFAFRTLTSAERNYIFANREESPCLLN